MTRKEERKLLREAKKKGPWIREKTELEKIVGMNVSFAEKCKLYKIHDTLLVEQAMRLRDNGYNEAEALELVAGNTLKQFARTLPKKIASYQKNTQKPSIVELLVAKVIPLRILHQTYPRNIFNQAQWTVLDKMFTQAGSNMKERDPTKEPLQEMRICPIIWRKLMVAGYMLIICIDEATARWVRAIIDSKFFWARAKLKVVSDGKKIKVGKTNIKHFGDSILSSIISQTPLVSNEPPANCKTNQSPCLSEDDDDDLQSESSSSDMQDYHNDGNQEQDDDQGSSPMRTSFNPLKQGLNNLDVANVTFGQFIRNSSMDNSLLTGNHASSKWQTGSRVIGQCQRSSETSLQVGNQPPCSPGLGMGWDSSIMNNYNARGSPDQVNRNTYSDYYQLEHGSRRSNNPTPAINPRRFDNFYQSIPDHFGGNDNQFDMNRRFDSGSLRYNRDPYDWGDRPSGSWNDHNQQTSHHPGNRFNQHYFSSY